MLLTYACDHGMEDWVLRVRDGTIQFLISALCTYQQIVCVM